MQLGWPYIGAIVLGVFVGIGLMLLYQRYRKPRSQVQLEAEHEKLKEDVLEHFVTTANLVNDMTDSYKAVFDHLNEGAGKLVDSTELRARLPQEDARVITLSRIGQYDPESQTNAESASSHDGEENGGQGAEEEDLEPPRF